MRICFLALFLFLSPMFSQHDRLRKMAYMVRIALHGMAYGSMDGILSSGQMAMGYTLAYTSGVLGLEWIHISMVWYTCLCAMTL